MDCSWPATVLLSEYSALTALPTSPPYANTLLDCLLPRHTGCHADHGLETQTSKRRKPPMNCTACGKANPDTARFCGRCGDPQKKGLKRPGTVSLALPYPPQATRIGPASESSVGRETLAGVGVVSARRVWGGIAAVGLMLFCGSALAVWVSVTPRGNAESDAPVTIAAFSPEDLVETMPAAEELPEGIDLDALVEAEVPGPEAVGASLEEPTVAHADGTGVGTGGGTGDSENPLADESTETVEAGVAPPDADFTQPATMTASMTTSMRAPIRHRPNRPTTPNGQTTTPAPWTSGSTMTGTTGTTGMTGMTPTRPTQPSTSGYTASTYGPAARRVVQTRYMNDIQRCFDDADSRRPGFSGTVLMSYMLTQAGQVASARVARNTTGDSQLGTCLSGAGRRWRLPPPPPRTLEFSMSFAR